MHHPSPRPATLSDVQAQVADATPPQQSVVGTLSADALVDMDDRTSAEVVIHNDVLPNVYLDADTAAAIVLSANADTRVRVGSGGGNSSVNIDTRQATDVDIDAGAGGGSSSTNVDVSTAIIPNVHVDTAATVSLRAQASPYVQINGANARVSIQSNIVPLIAITRDRGGLQTMQG
jgi:hypothetical protein